MDDLQKHLRHKMAIGQYLLLELKLDFCFSCYKIIGNGGADKVCTAPKKYSSDLCDNTSFRNKELCESKHVLNSTRCTRRILDTKYQKAYLSQIVPNGKHLKDNGKIMLHDVLTKINSYQRKSNNMEDETCRYRTTARRKPLSR